MMISDLLTDLAGGILDIGVILSGSLVTFSPFRVDNSINNGYDIP
jgi:hypothetical protein